MSFRKPFSWPLSPSHQTLLNCSDLKDLRRAPNDPVSVQIFTMDIYNGAESKNTYICIIAPWGTCKLKFYTIFVQFVNVSLSCYKLEFNKIIENN